VMGRILLVTSHPVAPPWDSADKQIARSLVSNVPEHHFTMFGRLGHRIPDARCVPVWSRSGHPGIAERVQVAIASAALLPAADLVHLVMTIGPGTARATRAWRLLPWRDRPVVHTVPGIVDESFLDGYEPFGITVALSERTGGLLRERGFDNVRVIPPAIPIQQWPMAPRPETVPTVLMAGHHDPGGGAEDAIRAVADVTERGVPARLSLAMRSRLDQDPGTEADGLRQLARSLGVDDAEVQGEVQDMPSLIRTASVVVLPATDLRGKADVPLVVLEAMATGRPVIVNDLPSFDALEDAAIRVPIGDPSSLATAITAVLEDDARYREHAERGRRLAEVMFPESRMAAAYSELYAELLDRDRRHERFVADIVWRHRASASVDAGEAAFPVARRNRVVGAYTRALAPADPRFAELAQTADRREADFRRNLVEVTSAIRAAGVTPVLIKANPADELAYGNFDLVVGDDGWDRSRSALRDWGVRLERHPLEPDKLIVHPAVGPAAHLHRQVSWFGIPILDAGSLADAARPYERNGAAWLVPAPEHELLIAVAHAAFQNLAFDLAELRTIRRLLIADVEIPAHVHAMNGGWELGFADALEVARRAIRRLDDAEDIELPVQLPVKVAARVALEHAGYLWRSGRRRTAIRELVLRGPLTIAKRRAARRS
jgi:glycosyltransferase involved in cell wall biosynthesis